jgi:hypothetical protein
MPESLLRQESPTEYFRDLVESALQHQRLAVHDLTAFYVVNLLAGFVHLERSPDGGDEEALGVRLMKALQSAGFVQRTGLRRVGDTSLFISGFFSHSLSRSLVDVDYYIDLGERAYGCLARQEGDAFCDVFEELAAKFPALVDVLTEVSERAGLTSNADVLRLYEKWLKTGSRRSGDLLVARGILPIAAPGSRLIQ